MASTGEHEWLDLDGTQWKAADYGVFVYKDGDKWATPLDADSTAAVEMNRLASELEYLRQELARKEEALFRNLLAEAIERVMPGMEGQTFADEEIAGEFCLRAKAALSPQADKEGE